MICPTTDDDFLLNFIRKFISKSWRKIIATLKGLERKLMEIKL